MQIKQKNIVRKLSSIQNRSSIISTIEEYDKLGKNKFLNKYSYRESTKYFIEYNNKEYDSKAIIGVSFKYEFLKEEPLRNTEFTGGLVVEKKLKSLGFKVIKKTIVNAIIKAFNILEREANIEELKQVIISNEFYTFGAQKHNINDVIRNQISRYCDNLTRKDSNKTKYFTKVDSKTFKLINQIITAKSIQSKKIKDLEEYESIVEGKQRQRYTYYYERNSKLREQSIQIHGITCKVCGFNFEEAYGEHGRDYIQIHHIKPLSESKETKINPLTDLIPLCANCHVMVHRKKNKTLTIKELRKIHVSLD